MSEAKHTPGPWQWVIRGGNEVTLVHPGHGWLTVMDFVRRGMQGGTFRLATWKGDERENMGGIMRPAHEIKAAEHPDARLIAAAPDLLAACQAMLAHGCGGDYPLGRVAAWEEAVSLAEAAIAKATGGPA